MLSKSINPMPQLAIIDYSLGKIELFNLSPETFQKFSDDFDVLVYEVLGYRQSDVYYMISEKEIDVCNHIDAI